MMKQQASILSSCSKSSSTKSSLPRVENMRSGRSKKMEASWLERLT